MGADPQGKRTTVARRFRDSSLQKLLLRLNDPAQAIDNVTLSTVMTLMIVEVSVHGRSLSVLTKG